MTNLVLHFASSAPFRRALPSGWRVVMAAFVFFALLAALSPAQEVETTPMTGSVDASFNPSLDSGSSVYAVAVQPDGKIIIGGFFQKVRGVAHANIARLNADGSVDSAFTASINNPVYAIGVQTDGKVVVGGAFTVVNGMTRNRIARLNSDGSLESTATFDPGTGFNQIINCVAVQADGKLVLGGNFTSFNGVGCGRIARLNGDGSLETTAASNLGTGANDTVFTIAVQADGKLVLGGGFTTINGSTRNRIARLNADGSLEGAMTFDPGTGTDGAVLSITVQADGKLVLGGRFKSVNGLTRQSLARLKMDGSLDSTDPFNTTTGPDDFVFGSALQADGKLVIGGLFTTVNDSPSRHFARINQDGSLESTATFDPGTGTDDTVLGAALQKSGGLLLAGSFILVEGTSHPGIARLINDPASQNLTAPDTAQVLWSRSGSAPEVSQVTFEQSSDGGLTWNTLGAGTRVGVSANWKLTGLSLPSSGTLRARGRTVGGELNGSTGLLEQVSAYTAALPAIVPGAPIIGTATAGDASASVTFSAPTDSGSSPITGYTVTSSPGGITGTGTASPITVTGLTNGTAYTFTVTAMSDAGTSDPSAASNSVTPLAAPPSALTYTDNSPTYTKGTAITANSPSNSGGAVVSYSVSPGLPAGLNLDPKSGVISGIPTAPTATATYTVTATNSGGFTTKDLSITVNDVAPSGLAYTNQAPTYTRGMAIPLNSPSSSGGAVTGYTVSPNLPAGLTLDPATGVLSGTPTAVSATATYTVTARNSGGSTTSDLSITVRAAQPSVSGLGSSDVSATTARLTANVTSDGGAPIMERGFVLTPTAQNSEPQRGDPGVLVLMVAGTTGSYTVEATGLKPQTAYSFAAYATNSAGTTNTGIGTFTTPALRLVSGGAVPGAGESGTGVPAGAKFRTLGLPGEDAYDENAMSNSPVFRGTFQAAAGGLQTGVFGLGGDNLLVAKTGDVAPGTNGQRFATLGEPVGRAGTAFYGTVTGAGPALGLWSNAFPDARSTLQLAARVGAAVPGIPSARYTALLGSVLNTGQNLFWAGYFNGAGVRPGTGIGIFAMSSVKEGPQMVLRYGQRILVNDQLATVRSFVVLDATNVYLGDGFPLGMTGFGTGRLDGGAMIPTRVELTDGRIAVATVDTLGTTNTVAVTRGEVPGISGAVWGTLGYPVAASSGILAFRGTLAAAAGSPGAVPPGTAQVLFAQREERVSELPAPVSTEDPGPILVTDWPVSSKLTLLARQGDAAPGLRVLKLGGFSDPYLNRLGDALYFAKLTGPEVTAKNQVALYWHPIEQEYARLVARAGSSAPDIEGAQIAVFTGAALPASFEEKQPTGPVFMATLQNAPGARAVTAANNNALWATDTSGRIRLLARTGMAMDGKTLKTIGAFRFVPSSQHQARAAAVSPHVIFLATYTDNSQAIVQLDVPPAWPE